MKEENLFAHAHLCPQNKEAVTEKESARYVSIISIVKQILSYDNQYNNYCY